MEGTLNTRRMPWERDDLGGSIENAGMEKGGGGEREREKEEEG